MKLRSLFTGSGSNKNTNENSIPWSALDTQEQLDFLQSGDGEDMVVLFKHSTSCGLSSMMLRRFQQLWGHAAADTSFYILDVIRYRDLSNTISSRYQVMHQTPQVLILKGNRLLAHASHSGINELRPEQFKKTPD